MRGFLDIQKDIDRLTEQIKKAKDNDKEKLEEKLHDLELEREWALI